MKLMPDIIGLSVIALAAYAGYWLIPDEQIRAPMWIFIFLIFAAIGLHFWRKKEHAETVGEWLGLAAGTIFLGMIFLAIDAVTGRVKRPDLSFLSAASTAGSPFGIVLTVLVCPCMTVICLAGAARAYVERRNKNNA